MTIIEEPDVERSAPVEFRKAAVDISDVDFAKRIITVVAVPYDEIALTEYRGELWRESFDRGSFDGIEKRPNRVSARRGHGEERTVGKAARFWPDTEEGLLTEIRISQTQLGDETLALADDDALSASVGFAVRGRDQILDRAEQRRRIRKAFLKHIAFVDDPAYEGARVLSVRSNGVQVDGANAPKLVTPNLDELLAWQQSRQAG